MYMYAYYVDPQWKKFQPDGRLYYHPLRNCTQIVCTLSLKTIRREVTSCDNVAASFATQPGQTKAVPRILQPKSLCTATYRLSDCKKNWQMLKDQCNPVLFEDVWRCLKIMSHSYHFCFQQWAVGRRLNPSFDPYFGLTKCEDCCICQFLRHIVPTEGFSGLSKMGKLRRNTPNGNLNRKNDNTLWNFDELCGTDGYSIFSHPHIHAIQLKWSEPWCSHVSFMCSRSHVRVLAQPCRVLFIKSWEFP